MKKIISMIAMSVLAIGTASVAFAGGASIKHAMQYSLNKSNANDLVPGCVTTKHNYKVCGYFPRGSLQKLPRAAQKDIYMRCFMPTCY